MTQAVMSKNPLAKIALNMLEKEKEWLEIFQSINYSVSLNGIKDELKRVDKQNGVNQ